MQFNPLSLIGADANGATNLVFSPRDITNGVATFVKSNGVPIADQRITFSSTRTASNGRTKLAIKIAIPVVQDQTVAGVSRPTLVRSAYADLTLTFDSTSNTAERNHVRNLLSSLLGSSEAAGLVGDLETLY